jgi:hypothetical protein
MYQLIRKTDQQVVGEISEQEMQFLRDNLEEEGLTDDDYTFTRLTLEFLRGNGMDPHLAQVLEAALGAGDEVELVYQAVE